MDLDVAVALLKAHLPIEPDTERFRMPYMSAGTPMQAYFHKVGP